MNYNGHSARAFLLSAINYFVPRVRHSRPHRTLFSRPLDGSSEIPVLIGFANVIERDRKQSDLSVLALSMPRVTGSLLIADIRCWNRPEVKSEVAILVADQRERGFWERECESEFIQDRV